jgi:bifunctional NMN adenylyltransferase/nudix hydrolase
VKLVKDLVAANTPAQANIGLIGHFKDDSSYYLQLFPDWTLVELESLKNSISATPMREAYYRGEIQTQYFPQGTIEFLQQFQNMPVYDELKQRFARQDSSSF